jgi:hypothetical protein
MPRAPSAYAVARVDADRYRLDGTTQDGTRPIAFVDRVHDRARTPTGWRLRPLVTMRGSPSTLWGSPAEALASTTLLSVAVATRMLRAADLAAAPDASAPA